MPRTSPRRSALVRARAVGRRLGLVLAGVLAAGLVTAADGREAHAQACCVGASGLTPGWLSNHEKWLFGAQLRLSATHGTYPSEGAFYARTNEREARVEPSLFATARVVPRGQVSVFAPLVATRRRSGGVVETRAAPGDVTLVGRYDLVRAGESRIPGIALLAGTVAPTGTPKERGTGLLSADVSGAGAWEVNAGLSVEQVFGRVLVHGTAMVGVRAPRDVLGLNEQLGVRALYLAAAGYTFDQDVTLLGSITHASEGDATVGGAPSPGTGFRTTQAALLAVVPLSDTMRLRTSVFTDVPPLGRDRPALGGTSISILKSWY